LYIAIQLQRPAAPHGIFLLVGLTADLGLKAKKKERSGWVCD